MNMHKSEVIVLNDDATPERAPRKRQRRNDRGNLVDMTSMDSPDLNSPVNGFTLGRSSIATAAAEAAVNASVARRCRAKESNIIDLSASPEAEYNDVGRVARNKKRIRTNNTNRFSPHQYAQQARIQHIIHQQQQLNQLAREAGLNLGIPSSFGGHQYNYPQINAGMFSSSSHSSNSYSNNAFNNPFHSHLQAFYANNSGGPRYGGRYGSSAPQRRVVRVAPKIAKDKGLSALLASGREFTAEDYETLLRLDEHHAKKKKGLDKKQRERSVTETSLSKKPEDKTCSICLEDYNSRNKLTQISNCGHRFHKKCLFRWLKQKPTCPICQGKVN